MVGKRVRGALYVHRSAWTDLSAHHQDQLRDAARRVPQLPWTVARLSPDHTGLMIYEDFGRTPFPALLEAWRIDLGDGQVKGRSYRETANPLILHRKELLVTDAFADRPVWAELTRQLVDRGLFSDPHRIGRRQAWEARLAKAGIRLDGHRLCTI
ncbi:MAG: hypothetical protein ACK4SI_09675 [Brevundimonas aurantiaca]|uniref:hypothetical protein n=1 Tax=Brevundimonas aurantiaca TaxID=74316 RepID=UPI00391BD533